VTEHELYTIEAVVDAWTAFLQARSVTAVADGYSRLARAIEELDALIASDGD